MPCIVETRYGRFRVRHPSLMPAVLKCVRTLDGLLERRAFCATGQGGGIDPTCPSGDGDGGDSGGVSIAESLATGGSDSTASSAASKAAKAAKAIDKGRVPSGSEQSTPEGHFAQAAINAAQTLESSAHDSAYKKYEGLSDSDYEAFASQAKKNGMNPEDVLRGNASKAAGKKFAEALSKQNLPESAKNTIRDVMKKRAATGSDAVPLGDDEIWVGDLTTDFAAGFAESF